MANAEMKEAKKGVAVFCPVAVWLMYGALVVLGVWLGWYRPPTRLSSWVWTTALIVGVWRLGSVPVLVAGRESLWLVRAFGLWWKRARRRDMVVLVLFPQGGLLLRTVEEVLEVGVSGKRGNRRVAETLRERFGVGIREEG